MALILSACQGKDKPAEDGGSDKAGKLKAGTYSVSEKGYKADIKLDVSFDDEKLTEIKIVESSETEDIGQKALESLIPQVVDKQSIAIDSISGATVTSEAFKEAIKKAIEQAGGRLEDFEKKVEAQEKEAKEMETDVVVIGGGGAGLSAAVSAAQEGAKVILVEKTGALGGNTVRAGGPYNAVDPERQKNVDPADQASMDKVEKLTEVEAKSDRHKELEEELQKDLDEYKKGEKNYLFDSKALHKLQTYDGGDYKGKLEFIEKLVDESLETSEWMAENGVKWKDDISTVPGGLWPRAHLPQGAAGGDYIKASESKAKELGVEILLNAPANELILDGEKVVGIKGTLDGAPLTIKAKSVVIATGGFSANLEMRKQYDPGLVETLPTTNSPAITGDGIKMAEAVDANLVGMEYIQSLPLGNPENGGLNGWIGGSGVEYYYQINKDGKRFMAEDGRRDVMTAALLEQEDQLSYVISSSENKVEITEKMQTIWGDNIEDLVKEKKVFRADTIEELAEQINVDPQVLKETHDKFNKAAEEGKDEEFGRTLFGKPLVTGPFYASARVPTVHHTMGGLEINLQGQVLNKDGKVVENLYAAGEVTGGIHGGNRLGGNALVDIHVFGREAGTNAAKNAK
ncbi:MAG: flavocytochrome c [Tissierellia bacterium]|nr:flavocytochrome c [Tissierellia bacterium]